MEKAILIGLKLPGRTWKEINSSIEELSLLANTAGGVVIQKVIQTRQKIDPALLIGRGKVKEIATLAASNGAKTIIFDEELTPAQQRNLERVIGAKIIDRTRLILDIFARRARTQEGSLQVELAQLEYYLPRLTQRGMWLDGQVGGIGTRGPGEKKLEYDRRKIRARINLLQHKINQIHHQRELQRQKRRATGIPVVTIIGYTNTGKSTLLNTLTKKEVVYADDKLFATLDPTTRRVKLPCGLTALFSDTVGFIRKLPHQLVIAFRATLEEIWEANCLIHLIDSTQEDIVTQEITVYNTLKELSADKIPLINVYNKCDLLSPEQKHNLSKNGYLFISAKTHAGIDNLLKEVEKKIMSEVITKWVTLSYSKSNLITILHKLSNIISQKYTYNGIRLCLQTNLLNWQRIQKYLAQ